MSEKTVLRLTIPEWHGGVNPNYVFGSELLSFIAPPNKNDETAQIAVEPSFHKEFLVIGSIGANATVPAGVTVGDGAIVAAGAVVTKDVPSNE